MSPDSRSLAYIDEDIHIAADSGSGARYLMEPSPFAKLVQLAEVGPSDFVLDVGCGTGYARPCCPGSPIPSLRSKAIPRSPSATDALADLGYDNVVGVARPAAAGHASEAPYDVIFVGGAWRSCRKRFSTS